MKRCKDCGPASKRAAPHPGPRCYTHHREAVAARREASHGRRIKSTYGITEAQYAALKAAQGGSCAICHRAKGIRRRLAVDHDHATGFVRGLLCTTCNKLLGHLRDDPELAYGIYEYLKEPPAFKEIGKVKPDD